MTATLDQPGLFDLQPEPQPRAKRTRALTHTPRPRRTKEAQAEECDPTCLTCGKPEGRGLCSPRCAIVCTHTHQPDLVEVCLVTTRVTAVLVEGARTLAAFPGREFTSHDIARVLGLSNTTARTALHRLADAGHVEILRTPDPALGKRLSTRYRTTTTTTTGSPR